MPLYRGLRFRARGRKLRPRRRLGLRPAGVGVRRRMARFNPTPTFVETFSKSAIVIPGGAGGIGGVFAARITDIPQIAQYANLYKQYRINWIKVMIIPDYNYNASDRNAAQYNATIPTGYVGMSRIAWAVNDSPALVAPANEAQLLEDNGCKVRSVGTKWAQSFKPVPDVSTVSNTGGNIAVRQKYKQFFNFDTVTTGNNPLHYGVSYWLTHLNPGLDVGYNVYYKVSFSLRDPQ